MYRRPGWVWRVLAVVLPIAGEMGCAGLVASQCGTDMWGTIAAVLLWWAARAEVWESWVIEEL